MKTLNEWQNEQQQHDNSDVLITNLKGLTNNLELEFRSYTGERFQGVVELIGAITEIKRILADIEHGTIGERKWISKFHEWQIKNENQQIAASLIGDEQAMMFLQRLNSIHGQLRDEVHKYRGQTFPGFEDIVDALGMLTRVLRGLGLPTQ